MTALGTTAARCLFGYRGYQCPPYLATALNFFLRSLAISATGFIFARLSAGYYNVALFVFC
jgi:hypothetical protein